MTLTGSDMPWRRKESNPVFLAENLVETGQIRQEEIQTQQPYRDYVRQA